MLPARPFYCPALATDAMTVATTAAVSVRRRCVPRVISSNPLAHAKAISSAEKSPSGPMKTRAD